MVLAVRASCLLKREVLKLHVKAIAGLRKEGNLVI